MSVEEWSLVVAVVAIVVSVASSAYTFLQSRHLAGSGFKAAEDLKVDLVTLLAALRSIVYKGIAASQDGNPRDLSLELEQVRQFQTSPSGYALAALAAEQGTADGSDSGRWRVLGLQFAELAGLTTPQPLEIGTVLAARYWATEVETTLGCVTLEHVDWMARKVADLPAMIGSLRQTRSQDMVLNVWYEIAARRRADGDPASRLPQLQALKKCGINDPDLDMWISLITDDSAALQMALAAGANQAVTVDQVLDRHRSHAADTTGLPTTSPSGR